jgi:hypothetical protein
MKFGLRAAFVSKRSYFRSRKKPARRPGLESLERRELLTTSTLVVKPSLGAPLTISTASPYGPPGRLFSESLSGGDYLGTLSGTSLLSTYSLDDQDELDNHIFPRAGTYSAAVTNDGTAFGSAVANAGAIAWLLTNIGPTAHTVDAQAALQAAIWREEYGLSSFQLDGADNNTSDDNPNDPTLIADYKADIAALGSKTAPLSSVFWISPTDTSNVNGGGPVQALVGFQDSSVSVETLTLPTTNIPQFAATYDLDGEITPNDIGGGNFLGKLGTTKLLATYCVNIDLDLGVPATFSGATVTHDATVWGQTVPNAGAISWLLTHIGPTATTPEQQDALQAAIWNKEYGTTLTEFGGNGGFQLDGADNKNAPFIEQGDSATKLVADYKADLAAVGSKTAAISDVLWITPNPDTGYPPSKGNGSAQGLVALAAGRAATTKIVVSSSANPTSHTTAVNFTVTVLNTSTFSKALPVGTVVVEIDGKAKGSLTLSKGKAVLKGIKLPVGTHTVTVLYKPANGNFNAGSGKLSGGEKISH